MQAFDKTLVLLLKGLDLTLEIVDESDEVLLGQLLRINDDGQNNLPLWSGSSFTLGHEGSTCKKNLSGG